VDKTDESAIRPGNPGRAYAGALGNLQFILRLSLGQRAQMIQQLQRSHGNGQVARAIARLKQTGPGRLPYDSRKRDARGPAVASTVAPLAVVQRQDSTPKEQLVPEFSVKPDLRLPRPAARQGDGGLLSPVLTELGKLISEAERLLLVALQGGQGITEKRLTDELFWLDQPRLRGEQALRAGSPEAVRWLRIRDEVARPLLQPSADGGHKGARTTASATAQPPGMMPADKIATESGKGESDKAAGASKVGTADKYFTQDVGHYQDVSDEGKPRLWLYGSSGANVCNMTSLTMSLVSMAGEPAVRAKMISFLRSSGMHAGAMVKVGGKWVSLAKALDDPKIADRIELIDLVTAVAIGKHGEYADVTTAKTIARVARETGLATAKEATGPVHLSDAKVRGAAAQMLAEGKRVIAGTVNHYVYLIEVRDEGVVLHDPAGARVTPGLTAPIFLHNGEVSQIAHEFFKLDAQRRATALRRVSTNAEAAAVVNELPRIAEMPKADRVDALRELARAHPGHISIGALNFYAISEFAANDLRLRLSLSEAQA
jgi:hypothetical protein